MAFATPNPPRPQPLQPGGAVPNPTDSAAAALARPRPPRQAHQQYQRARIETASPTQLVVLLYEGAIRFCSLAKEALQARAIEGQNISLIEAQNTNLIKAQRILAELMSSLDRKAGGDMAENLFGLYTYMLEQLVQANLYDQVKPIEDVLKLLGDLRDSWVEVDRLTTQGGEISANTPQPANTQTPAAPSRLGNHHA